MTKHEEFTKNLNSMVMSPDEFKKLLASGHAASLFTDHINSDINGTLNGYDENETDEQKSKKAALRRQFVSSISTQLTAVRAEISNLTGRNFDIEGLLEKLAKEEKGLRKEQEDLKTERPKLEKDLETAEKAEAEAKAAVEDAEIRVKREQRAVLSATDSKEATRAEIRLEKEEGELSEREQHLKLRERAVLDSKVKLETLDTRLEQVDGRLAQIEQEKSELTSERDQNLERITKLENEEVLLTEAQTKLNDKDFRAKVANGEVTTEQALNELSPELRKLAEQDIHNLVRDETKWAGYREAEFSDLDNSIKDYAAQTCSAAGSAEHTSSMSRYELKLLNQQYGGNFSTPAAQTGTGLMSTALPNSEFAMATGIHVSTQPANMSVANPDIIAQSKLSLGLGT